MANSLGVKIPSVLTERKREKATGSLPKLGLVQAMCGDGSKRVSYYLSDLKCRFHVKSDEKPTQNRLSADLKKNTGPQIKRRLVLFFQAENILVTDSRCTVIWIPSLKNC